MQSSVLIDGRRRSYVTVPGHNRGMKPPNAGHTYPTEIPTRDEVLRAMSAFGRGPSGDRYRAAVVLMYRCGLRVSECLALQPKDVDLKAGTVTVLRGKGHKRRTVGIDVDAAAILEKWLVRRRELGVGPGKPIICLVTRSRVGKAIHSSVLREAYKRAGKKAGIERRLYLHGLRHAFAVELAREGVSMVSIQRALGHSSLRTTERYLTGMHPVESIDAVRNRTWLGSAPAPVAVPVPDLLAALSSLGINLEALKTALGNPPAVLGRGSPGPAVLAA